MPIYVDWSNAGRCIYLFSLFCGRPPSLVFDSTCLYIVFKYIQISDCLHIFLFTTVFLFINHLCFYICVFYLLFYLLYLLNKMLLFNVLVAYFLVFVHEQFLVTYRQCHAGLVFPSRTTDLLLTIAVSSQPSETK